MAENFKESFALAFSKNHPQYPVLKYKTELNFWFKFIRYTIYLYAMCPTSTNIRLKHEKIINI